MRFHERIFHAEIVVDNIAFGIANGPKAYKRIPEIVNFNNAEVLVQVKIGVNYKLKQDDLIMLIEWMEQIKANLELQKLIKDEKNI